MAGLFGLTGQTLGSTQTFNWTWFIELVTCGILVLWFTFYLNRLFATAVSYGLRTYTWHKFRVYLDIKSLQISFLGGRIFFKGVRYHGENETVYIHNGHLTWRYWLRATKQIDLSEQLDDSDLDSSRKQKEEDAGSSSESDTDPFDQPRGNPEARLLISISGLEWFIYNRTPVYDAIVQESGIRASSSTSEHGRSTANAISQAVQEQLRQRLKLSRTSDASTSSEHEKSEHKDDYEDSFAHSRDQAGNTDADSMSSDADQAETDVSSFYSFMLRFFPVGIECSRGAVSLGNQNTKAIVVTTFEKAKGNIDAGASGPADIFRQIFDFNIAHPVVQMKPNPDFHLPQMAAAERVITGHESVLKGRPWWRINLNLAKRRRSFTSGLRNLVPSFRRSVADLRESSTVGEDEENYTPFNDGQPGDRNWHGLDRYMDEDEGDDHQAWMNIEYARYSTILDCPHIRFKFFWDTPGAVKAEHMIEPHTGLAADLNGITPPAYGMHLDVFGGHVNYGPWSDRLRVEIQNVFLPAGYKNAQPKSTLSEGETRLSSIMNITVNIRKDITLRVPSREGSKDWRWRGRATAVRDAAALRRQHQRRHFRFRRASKRRPGPDVRPFGWISILAGADSRVRYTMDMYPGQHGYCNALQLTLKNTTATSSVNHATLWECEEQNVSADLSNPLGWNEPHTWRFDIMNKKMNLFLLRDHTALLIDLIADFTAGQKSDYMTFMPFHYTIGVKFSDLALYLNSNDYNIIDNPSDLEENAFLILGFAGLTGQVDIPMHRFSPAQSSVIFKGDGEEAFLKLTTPTWHTLHNFGRDETMATLKTLKLDGSYNYYAGTSPKFTDSLFMTIIGGNPLFHLQGYLIRYFMNVKENYFGENIHFSTIEEHQAKLESLRLGEEEKKPPPKKQNDLDVILSVRADSSAALMPAGIYDRDENLRIDVLLIEADMRFTNYYMDLQVTSSPIEVSAEKISGEDKHRQRTVSSCQLFINGIDIYGHRLFGAPPTEPTYLCNWDFAVGQVTGECTTDCVRIMLSAVMSFIFTMDDYENALTKIEGILIPDVTFLRMKAADIRVWIVSSDTAFLIAVDSSTVELNDWANKHFSKYIKINAPLLLVAAVESNAAYRYREDPNRLIPTTACLRTSVRVAVLDRKADFVRHRALQQEHIRFHDSRSHRADWLLLRQHKPVADKRLSQWGQQPLPMPVPSMPLPVQTVQSNPNKVTSSTSFLLNKKKSKDRERRQDCVTAGGTSLAQSQLPEASQETSSQKISSPWVGPMFQLRNVWPDVSNLPVLNQSDLSNIAEKEDYMDDDDFPATKEEFVHNGIFCNLFGGIVGFCDPSIAGSIVTMVNEISPRQPRAILDDLQMQVMSNIAKMTAEHTGHIDDLSFRLPAAHIRVVSPHTNHNLGAGHDRCDIMLHDVRAIARIAPTTHSRTPRTDSRVHISLQNLSVELSVSTTQAVQDLTCAKLNASDAGLWLSLKESIRARAQLSQLDVVVGDKNIDTFASLIQRTEQVAVIMTDHLKLLNFAHSRQHLLYHLTSDHDYVDPPFMSKPVNVLRAADTHIRMSDSWKMITRLRHILLSQVEQRQAPLACDSSCCEDQEEVHKHILASFDKWSSWDTAGKDDNAIVQAVFGTARAESVVNIADVELEFLLGKATLSIDHGSKRSQVLVQSLDLSYEEKPTHSDAKAWEMRSSAKTRRASQLYANTVSLRLEWALVNLVTQILELSSPTIAALASEPNKSFPKAYAHKNETPELIIVIGSDAASLQLAGLNFDVTTGVERFKASVNVVSRQAQEQIISVLMSASSGRLRVKGLGRGLLSCKVTIPTIYINMRNQSTSEQSRLVAHAAVSSDKLRLHLKQDVLQLLSTVQAVLAGEAVAIQRLTNVLPASNEQSVKSQGPTAGKLRKVEPHLALFLDDYLMQFDLMTYLRYQVSGNTARTSIVPGESAGFLIQVDLKDSQHSFESSYTRESQHKSSLAMPPVSATVNLSLLPDRTRLEARVTAEFMHLDASAVRACFDAAYRPQTIPYIQDVKHAVAGIQTTMKSTFPAATTDKKDMSAGTETTQIEYRAWVIFEGVRIYCIAPALRPDQSYSVNLNFLLGAASMQISNLRHGSDTTLTKPNFNINFHRISVDLERVALTPKNFGRFATSFKITCNTDVDQIGTEVQHFRVSTLGVYVDLHSETMVLAVDLISFLQARIKSLAAAEDAKKLKPLRRLTLVAPETQMQAESDKATNDDEPDLGPLESTIALQLNSICVRWLVRSEILANTHSTENMAFTVSSVSLKTTRDASARLTIRGLQLQLVPQSASNPFERTANSALLPEMIFNAAYARTSSTRKFAFKAAGKHLDVRLASNFIIPAAAIQKSLAEASTELRKLKLVAPKTKQESTQIHLPKLLGTKRLAQLLVFADFGGAEVTVSPAKEEVLEQNSAFGLLKGPKRSKVGKYGQAVQSSTGESATLRSPGIAFQIEYADPGHDDPTLSTEIRVAASSNTLAPSVVPLILEISASVTNLMEQDNSITPKTPHTDSLDEAPGKNAETMQQATDPTAILGRVKLNAGLLVQKQEFSLTCQPVARVSATARFDEIFVTINTVQAKDQDRFFSISTTLHNLSASVQHVYSRDSTAQFTVESIMLSLMNSKHFSNQSGISAIMNISPMKGFLNAKQMQDFLLFREIWYPPELRASPSTPGDSVREETQEPVLQRFQEVTTTSVLPWHAIVSIAELKFHVDFGQSIGKADFSIQSLWASSKKNSDAEQNLVIGLDSIGIESKGRTSGFVELQGFRVRTGIRWPVVDTVIQAPLVQGSVGFEHLKASAVFDYQPFAVADVSTFDFLIYNVRQAGTSDRLVGILDGGKVQAFGITTAAAQGLSIIQAFERLVQEKQEAFEASLHELDRFLRRKSIFPSAAQSKLNTAKSDKPSRKGLKEGYAPRLHVDVVITLQAIDAGVFMSSFHDETCLKLEAIDVQARFSVGETEGKTHSGLGMSLGQVRLALSALARPNAGALREVSVSEVIERATAGRGGTILKVPRLVASMQTWQRANSNAIEYIFHSIFQGKVDIGWNYSRISTIRNMWESHSRALALKISKPLPPSAIKITAEPKNEAQGQEKITAVVHMPQSKYEYIALQPPVIDTPQLRDLGEATPSLEWIGLHRERLPHVTHSILIVSLLEVAREIEGSYSRILGSGER